MKIAVFSDSHGTAGGMIKAVREYAPDQIIFLGDGYSDTAALEREFPAVPVCAVPGNCDYDCVEPEYKVIRLGGMKAFLTHGHRYAVRYGKLDALLYAADCNDCRIAMFGHTHRAFFDCLEGMFVLNPGTVGQGRERSWAKLELGPTGEISCEIVRI